MLNGLEACREIHNDTVGEHQDWFNRIVGLGSFRIQVLYPGSIGSLAPVLALILFSLPHGL